MVKNKLLLLFAGIIWLIAGFNILRIGVLAYAGYIQVLNILLSLVVFSLFWFFVFSKLVKKHTKRICGYETPKQYFWKFFDKKSFIIMVFMITLGICIRTFNLAPTVFIAVFYVGLGSSLCLAGIKFLYHFFTVEL